MENGEEVVPVPLGMSSVSTASLNCLPDELLVQVLSSLETKQAASTSVLSKRWRNLFAVRRNNLDFDDSIFSHPEEGKQDRDDIQESFRDFVDKTLDFQDSVPINKFSLKCGNGHDDVCVDRWINTALEHGVSELRLCLTSVTRRLFPSNVFRSKTLVKLTLGTKLIIVCFPSDTCLPVLKILVLDSVWCERTKFSTVLLAGCPALEDLTIDQKSFPGLPNVVSSKTIKRLSIVYKRANDADWFRTVALDTPKLVTLFYSTYARHRYRHCNLDSLVKATLDLHFLENEIFDEAFEPNVTDLMIAVRNVKILHLTSSATEVISQCCKGGLPVFENLLGLVFLGNTERVWKVFFPLLLENSPNLTTLFLEGLYHCTDEHEFDEIRIPRSNKVNMLRIIQCQGSENEMKHISHFLLKMECLQLVHVNFSETIVDSKKVQLTEDLFKLPTASSKLKMQII